MGYVNEYGTDEDIERYKLNELWDRYYPKRGGRFWGRRPELTIDRDKDAFLMVKSSGAGSEGYHYTFLLSIRGQVVFASMKLADGTSRELNDRPFYQVWDFDGVRKEEGNTLGDSEIIREIKKALTAYGYGGVGIQVPDTVVKFKF